MARSGNEVCDVLGFVGGVEEQVPAIDISPGEVAVHRASRSFVREPVALSCPHASDASLQRRRGEVVSSDGGLTRQPTTLGAVRPPHREALDAMFDEHLAMPFQTCALGVGVTVTGIDLADDDQIVAVCARGRWRQRIGDPGFAVAGACA
jgi:hypothetical protein